MELASSSRATGFLRLVRTRTMAGSTGQGGLEDERGHGEVGLDQLDEEIADVADGRDERGGR